MMEGTECKILQEILQELGLWFARMDNVQGSAWMVVTGLQRGGEKPNSRVCEIEQTLTDSGTKK